MKKSIPLYILTVALLAASVYLKSPLVAVATVVLWGVQALEAVFTRSNKELDIVEIQATLAAHKAQMASLTRDITNVSERARTILGENF